MLSMLSVFLSGSNITRLLKHGMDGAAREPADHGAVHTDVLEIVARMLLDHAHGALGAERAHAVLDEHREAPVMPLHELEHAGLRPRVELLAKAGVLEERVPRAL